MGNVLPYAPYSHRVSDPSRHSIDSPRLSEIDHYDYNAKVAAKQQEAKDQAMDLERINILREGVAQCYRQYGVNNQWKCRPLYLEYAKRIQPYNLVLVTEEMAADMQ